MSAPDAGTARARHERDHDRERDGRRRVQGPAALLVFVYALFALSATARSLVQILREFDRAPVPYLLSLLAALTYIAVTVVLLRWGPACRAALVLVGMELAGVLVVGTLSVLDPALFPDATVWSGYGIGYGLVPLLLPLAALALIVRAHRRSGRSGPR